MQQGRVEEAGSCIMGAIVHVCVEVVVVVVVVVVGEMYVCCV